LLRDLLKSNSDLRSIYNTAADSEPIIRAIADSDGKGQIVLVGHELTEASRIWLATGSIDAILNQNTAFIVDGAIQTLSALCSNTFSPHHVQQLAPIEIYLGDNLPPRENSWR
jgi:ABC-type sugar transport system substrate-binding protein